MPRTSETSISASIWCSVKGAEEIDQVLLFLSRQVQRMELWIEVRIWVAAGVVKVDQVFERCETALVRVRRGVCNVAQRGRLEGASVGFVVRDGKAAVVVE